MFEHQAAGLVTEFVFSSTPTAAQHDQMWARLAQKYGTSHPKYKDPAHEFHGQKYTMEAREFELLDANAVIPPLDEPTTVPRIGVVTEMRALGVHAEGNVKNP